MRTHTRAHIIRLIKERTRLRPVELASALKISPQALHRHLKALVSQGLLEPQGKPPLTSYALAGVPDLSSALTWFTTKKATGNSNSAVCETRDVFTARLSQLKTLVKQGLPNEDLPLVIAVTGEIGNNSFDHNIGQWRDVPGCWFQTQVTGGRLWLCIADRGQGILKSLLRTDPSIESDQKALEVAFEKRVSGRAPERRGNGLKFVRNAIVSSAKDRGLACFSGAGRYFLGNWDRDRYKALEPPPSKANGTLTFLTWELS